MQYETCYLSYLSVINKKNNKWRILVNLNATHMNMYIYGNIMYPRYLLNAKFTLFYVFYNSDKFIINMCSVIELD